MGGLRIRNTAVSVKSVTALDAFPKVPESYVKTSKLGGTLSLISYILISWLLYSELKYYYTSRFIFKFVPDTDINSKLTVNIDLTVAMPCAHIGADILDSTNQNVFAFGTLEEEDTWFELAPEQRSYFDYLQHYNSYLREEFHALSDVLWRSGQSALRLNMPHRSVIPDRPKDACRIYGSLTLNKVAGNFHITAGKSLHLPMGHVHISGFMSEADSNFTHRIHRLSFGDDSPGIIHPMEGDEKITANSMMLYQYFIEVVPTDVETFLGTTQSCQYSVKELSRPIDHASGSHGIAGIFVKYDMSALKVKVQQERDSLPKLLTRLCATIAGIHITMA
ncbi:endoplasmic reticulum-Golgi intermediate compartment protein 2-like [Ctenocephalides felis]|uniref:endoplasmic reticulum-Golgi intermediate compartment protein 2-like n=1 Tax=Ctenocephalides felis TaxID=7515 RepID=UPI000E6E5161|nr:endoplasmic reticulum-Golgi intermediate compartment protein 2-like isoform X2 [Ctenocephalides felis]XP_026474406.1 endoplasmic reticulum-Golgi intermediate compartment protein 2-like [Ctenocephalides felis]